MCGRNLPRRAVRRSIPAQAFGLKKYRGGIEPRSSTCDKEHTTASLGHAEILGIQDSPCDCSLGTKHNTRVRPRLPWRLKFPVFSSKCTEKAAEGVAFVAEYPRNVFPNND